jgi:succinate dehydrogenase hydrophobic anchor subunit
MDEISRIYISNMSLDNAVNITLLFILVIYLIYSLILYYHWKAYSSDIRVTAMTLITYFSTTIPLMIIMTILAFII